MRKKQSNVNNLNEAELIDYLVTGYIRKLELTYKFHIPSSLINLMINLYPRSWKFIDRKYQNNKCTIADDELTVQITRGAYVSVQFGEFFSNATKMIYKFKFKTGYQNHNGIGFITKEYDDFQRGSWNDGFSHSMVYYSNGYCVYSPCFSDKKRKWAEGWYDASDEIIVKINTHKMEALIWNYSKLKKDDIQFDDHNKNDKYQHLIDFPNDIEAAIIMEMGCSNQSISCIDQQFTLISTS